MKKKALAVLLVLALFVTAASAKDVGVKVGGELGMGFDIVKTTAKGTFAGNTVTQKGSFLNYGFQGSFTAEYEFTDELSLKASVGLMFAGKTKTTSKFGDSDTVTNTRNENGGTYLDVILDAKYKLVDKKNYSFALLGGVEMVSGHVLKTGNEDTDKDYKNLALGLNAAPELSFSINKNVDINIGASFSWLFYNNAKALKESSSAAEISGKTLLSASYSATSFYIRPYAGCTYSF